MRLEDCRKIEKLHAVKPKFQVTGVSFGGYGSQYDGKQKNISDRKISSLKKNKDSVDCEQILHGKPEITIRGMSAGALHSGKYKSSLVKGKNAGVAVKEKSSIVSAYGVHTSKVSTLQNIVVQRGKMQEEDSDDQIKSEEDTVDTMSNSERAYFIAVKLAEDKKERAKKFTTKGKTDEDSGEEEKFTDQKEAVKKERILDVWKQETVQENDTRGGISQDELIRRCNVCSKHSENMPGVKNRTEMAENCVSEKDELEPWVCSETEREKIKQEKTDKTEKNKEKEGTDGRRKKHRTDKVKRKLLKRYVINELIHQEGKQDPNAHFKLAGSIIIHDIGRLVKFVTKLILQLMWQLILFLMPVILIAAVMIIPIAAVYYYMINPTSYYDNVYDMDEEIAGNTLYIKNVVQEMCRDFTGEVQTLEDNWRYEVKYEYGKYPDADEIIAVYLAQVCTTERYKDMSQNAENGYPQYLLIDTQEEKELLNTVFEQFNYMATIPTIIKFLGADEEWHTVPGWETTVYCLTLTKWKELHLSELSADAKELLEDLEEKLEDTGGSSDNFAGAEDAVPIEDLVIPEGVDENLIYMAGFIRAEAGNQPALGKTAVAYVILNRAGGPTGNIKGVLTAPYQFSCYIPYHTVEKYLTAYASMTQEEREADACYQAAEGAYYGTSQNPIGDMKYYCNPKYCSVGEEAQWAKIRAKNTADEIIIIGDHVFCKNCW